MWKAKLIAGALGLMVFSLGLAFGQRLKVPKQVVPKAAITHMEILEGSHCDVLPNTTKLYCELKGYIDPAYIQVETK